MEGADWLRRGILVSNLPTSDDVTRDKLEIHFSKRGNGGGDVEEIIMLDDYMAMVKFKEEKTVDSVLSKSPQYLLDSILTITRYTMSDVEQLKTSRANFFSRSAMLQQDQEDSDGLESEGQSSVDQCSCYDLFQIFENISVSVPFKKLQSGLLEPGKRQTLNRLRVKTGVKWEIDYPNQLLRLTGSFEEIREASKMLQNYTIEDEVHNGTGVDVRYSGVVGNIEVNGLPQGASILALHTAKQTVHEPVRCPPEQSRSQMRNHQRSATNYLNSGKMNGNTSSSSDDDASQETPRSGSPMLKLRHVKPDDTTHDRQPSVPVNHETRSRADPRKEILRRQSPPRRQSPVVVVEGRQGTAPGPRKESQFAKVDVACPDTKLARYLMSVRKADVEEIQKRFSVSFTISENGQVTLEVRRDMMNPANIRNAIGEFNALRDRIREKDPEVVSFSLKKLGLTEEGLRDVCGEAQEANPETNVTLGDDSSVQIYGIGDALQKAKHWMSENVQSVEEDEDGEEEYDEEEDIEVDGEEEEDAEEEGEEEEGEQEEDDDDALQEVVGGVSQLQFRNATDEFEPKEKRRCPEEPRNSLRKQHEQRSESPDPRMAHIQGNTNGRIGPMGMGEVRLRSSRHLPGSSPNPRNHGRNSPPITQTRNEISSSSSFSSSAVKSKADTSNVAQGIDKIEQKFDQKVLEFIQATRYDDVTRISNKHHVNFEMKRNGVVEICKKNTPEASDIKLKVGLCAFMNLVKSVKDLESEIVDLNDYDDVNKKVLDTSVAGAKKNKHVLVIHSPGCKVEFYGGKDHVRTAVDNFKKAMGKDTSVNATNTLPNGAPSVESTTNQRSQRPNYTVSSSPSQPSTTQAATPTMSAPGRSQYPNYTVSSGPSLHQPSTTQASTPTVLTPKSSQRPNNTIASGTSQQQLSTQAATPTMPSPGRSQRPNSTLSPSTSLHLPSTQAAAPTMSTPGRSFRPSTNSNHAAMTEKPVVKKPTSREIKQVFDQKILDYIEVVEIEEINKIKLKYGVDFEAKGNGVVHIRQSGNIEVSDIKMRVGKEALKSMLERLSKQLTSHTIDLREFDVHKKILDNAIAEAKQSKGLLVTDGPGCKIELFGTRENIKTAVDNVLKVIKSEKRDNTPTVTAHAVGKPRPSDLSASGEAFGNYHGGRPGGSGRINDDLTDVDGFGNAGSQTRQRNGDPFRSSGSSYMDTSSPHRPTHTSGNGIWGDDSNSLQPMSHSILSDPRNYMECNDDAKQLIQDATETDGGQGVAEDHWYQGELNSVVPMPQRNRTQNHPHLTSRGIGASFEEPMEFEDIGGAHGETQAAQSSNRYFADSDDSADETAPEGLLNDISAYELDLQDTSPPAPSSTPTVLQTSAGFEIEIQQGDITQEFVSVIVSSADPQLGPHTGVGRAIREAGGRELVRACEDWVKLRGEVDSSRPVYTIGGNLMCSQVLHVVPPDMASMAGNYGRNPLTGMMQSILKICHQPLKAISIALPAIGKDALQMGKKDYARHLFEAILDCIKSPPQNRGRDSTLQKLRIVDRNAALINTLREVFTRMSQDPMNRGFFQPGSGASTGGSSRLSRAQSARHHSSTGARPKGPRARRSGSLDRDENHRSPFRNPGMFHSEHGERLKRSTIAASFRDSNDFDNDDLVIPFAPLLPRSGQSDFASSSPSTSRNDDADSEADDQCPICLDALKQPKTLKCKHTFCRTCLEGSVKHQGQTCPVCKEPFGKGRRVKTMPPGKMDVRHDPYRNVPGYPDANGAIVITYTFTSGVQGPNHPNPGRVYGGATRTAYLPDNPEGQAVLNFLKRAFDSKLTFTVGTSSSTGEQNVIVWNDIHHKINLTGGPSNYGYPDPGYLARVRQELEDKGIR